MNFSKNTLADVATIKSAFKNNDFAVITAWRDNEGICGDGKPISLAQKRMRNNKLKRDLKLFNFHQAIGVYLENQDGKKVPVKEDVFIVISDGTLAFHNKIKKLGAKYLQDTVLIGKADKKGVLVGTSKCPTADPKLGGRYNLGLVKFGRKGDNYTILKNGTFIF
jgi:hypothetical protein